ncbi:unnamed protein product [Menidia menidia]|uniref:(Atlantic silverside) hypothetical protein n=1 Tax=Menidia menidia TaxID=238744 RepID=A0A8S4B269_9TELE|nr:unnamed protein product [Menidia menidia]
MKQGEALKLKEPVAGPSGGQQLRLLLQEVLQILMDEGLVYRRVRSQDELYHVTSQDKELLMAVRDVIREDSRREKYVGRGVHVLHVLSAVRQRFSLNVSRGALELVLSALELSSDIISTGGSHYTASKKRQYDQEVENLERQQKQSIERLEQEHTTRLRDEAKRIKAEQDRELAKLQNLLKNRRKEEQEFLQKQQQDLDSALKKIIQQHKHELATVERDCLNHKQQLLRGAPPLCFPF